MGEPPLKDVTVLDLGQIYNGPYCGYLLAMSGARVIKVEAPKGEGHAVGRWFPCANRDSLAGCHRAWDSHQ